MSRTTVFRASLWLALPIVAVAGQLAMAANHAPVLDASKSPVLAPECENAGAPSGAVGTLVSALVDFAVPAGQIDNVTDSDAGAKLGISVHVHDANRRPARPVPKRFGYASGRARMAAWNHGQQCDAP